MQKVTTFPVLQNKNRAEFAKRYNGPAFAQNGYDTKLASAYLKLKAGL
ncbi:N-acetylmuramidase family protein [Bacteroides fragilis]|nr:N-acetylmuramidase domain-containing protein [Bacteroides fragilis]MCE8615786.1 N-acetylmuramidase family protein [Bacteroides fragilis]MCS2211961.1 N-acetylmuramidase family protein [Bacteroides fragilis]MCS2254051.1 N-acetylmuramidase family protein [Bacteroides fragilis]MCS3223651.1 N-acetylmuramidase family protein [Bacteroides fragilis]MCZ2602047.1 N-acetylmuramidase domain-containing protein [Bacteroides fragilis]